MQQLPSSTRNSNSDTSATVTPTLSSYYSVSNNSRDARWRSSSSGSVGSGSGGWGGGGGGGGNGVTSLPPSTDPFWAPVVPDAEPAAAVRLHQQSNSSDLDYGFRQGGRERGRDTRHLGTIDRPASRGQEYRRERRGSGRRGRVGSSSSSSLAGSSRVSDSRVLADQGQASADGNFNVNRRRFLGILWPPVLTPGSGGEGRGGGSEDTKWGWEWSGSTGGSTGRIGGGGRVGDAMSNGEDKSTSVMVKGKSSSGVGGFGKRGAYHVHVRSSSKDGDPMQAGGESLHSDDGGLGSGPDIGFGGGIGRLRVTIEGSTELGKGLGGHTAYRIQVGLSHTALTNTLK